MLLNACRPKAEYMPLGHNHLGQTDIYLRYTMKRDVAQLRIRTLQHLQIDLLVNFVNSLVKCNVMNAYMNYFKGNARVTRINDSLSVDLWENMFRHLGLARDIHTTPSCHCHAY